MTHFMRNGSSFQVASDKSLDLYETLPTGTYTAKYDQMSGQYYLDIVEDFSISHKLYGDTEKKSKRIHDTFADRPSATGVMLSGEQGSGKTLLAKKVSVDGLSKDIPTIVINQPHCGETFNQFIQTIEQPVIVIFDEFEKVYDNESQEKLLTLLDGVYPSKKLFIITCNDRYRVNQHMRNRPGRVFYRIEYKGLSQEFVYEYCQDNLLNKDMIDSVARISVVFNEFNFDMLKGMVEEMNRYGETPQEVMSILNAKPEYNSGAHYKAVLEVNGQKVTDENSNWYGNPLSQEIEIDWLDIAKAPKPESPGDDDNDDFWEESKFSVAGGNLLNVDGLTGRFTFTNPEGHTLYLVKAETKAMDYGAF